MNGIQCDTCRTFTAMPPPEGWLFLARQEAPALPSMLAMISGGGGGGAELAGTFCSLRCLTEYAYVRLAAEGTQGGMPGAEGWLG